MKILFKLHICIILLLLFQLIYSHGTKYEIIQPKYITIQASFDSGVPMALADVLIFAPEETKPVLKTKTDTNGIFSFTPDKQGIWSLQVRDKNGHGMRINLDINESLQIAHTNIHSYISTFQKIIMAICVAWGLIGTALFFKQKRKG